MMGCCIIRSLQAASRSHYPGFLTLQSLPAIEELYEQFLFAASVFNSPAADFIMRIVDRRVRETGRGPGRGEQKDLSLSRQRPRAKIIAAGQAGRRRHYLYLFELKRFGPAYRGFCKKIWR